MSSGLLLRLFESSFFNVHLAVSYLKTYSDSIGITHYLIERLRGFDDEEVEFYWPQLCHLLVTRPSHSTALESFILSRCEESTHIAMLTLWFLQGYLHDLSQSSSRPVNGINATHTSPSFAITRRVFNRVQKIIFTDPDLQTYVEADAVAHETAANLSKFGSNSRMISPTNSRISQSSSPTAARVAAVATASSRTLSPLSSSAPFPPSPNSSPAKASLKTRFKAKLSLSPQSHPALIGMGVVTSAMAMPGLAGITGKVAIEQGQRRWEDEEGGFAAGGIVRKGSWAEEDSDLEEEGASSNNVDGEGEGILGIKLKSGGSTFSGPLSRRDRSQTAPPARKILPGIKFPPDKDQRKSSKQQQPNYLPGSPLEPPPNPITDSFGSAFATPPHAKRARQDDNALTGSAPPATRYSESVLAMEKSSHSGRKEVSFDTPPPTPSRQGLAPSMAETQRSPPLPRRATERATRSAIGMNHTNPSTPQVGPSFSVPTFSNKSTSSLQTDHPYGSSSSSLRNLYPIPKPYLSALLRLHSCRAQLDLLRTLQDISTRLVIVPKKARLSALRAELTVLNHGLPRGCCLGMGCPGEGRGRVELEATVRSEFRAPSDSSLPPTLASKHKCRPHNRIVRIAPSEAVVLNSADRAPFLMHVEILEGDLDFDPDRRQNAEDVRRVLLEGGPSDRRFSVGAGGNDPRNGGNNSNNNSNTGENSLTRASADTVLTPGSNSAFQTPLKSPSWMDPTHNPQLSPSEIPGSPDSAPSPSLEQQLPDGPPEEEVDMVEQLYGDLPIRRDVSLDEFVPERDIFHNRSIDEEAWARRRESISIKSPPPSIPDANPFALRQQAQPSTSSVVPSRQGPSGPTHLSQSRSRRRMITLDEYAERMRMAAIMLAQLTDAQQEGWTATGAATGAASGLVGVAAGTVVGLGGVVGAGLGAVVNRFASKRDSDIAQAGAGMAAELDTTTAANGLPSMHSMISQQQKSAVGPGQPPSGASARQRILPHSQASAIRDRIMTEMMALEEERMQRMKEDGKSRAAGWTTGASEVQDESVVLRVVNKEDPSGAAFQESWPEKRARIQAASPYGHLATWDVLSVIVKTGADLRQEQFAVQLIKEFARIWKEEGTPHWVRYFRILVTSESSGLIETITDAVSIHSIKKDAYVRAAAAEQPFKTYSLYDHFIQTFGDPTTSSFRKAQDSFVKSLAGYSVLSYLLQLKDRHNGNILVDKEGHMIHIDFGFMLSNSPGSIGFEAAPFKLTADYMDIMGGLDSERWFEFKRLFKEGFRAIRKHAERVITIVELMQKDSRLPCFAAGEQTSQLLRDRFQLGLPQAQVDEMLERLIFSAAGSVYTRLYDVFQQISQGVL